ncbi:MAG TPA: 4Fe-4S binding protein [Nitrospirae bacterium]|nr:4Fe-4S binding protein [Nitrospirota bacterium]
MPIDKIRKIVLMAILFLFTLQFFGIKFLSGSLTGSLLLWDISLIDIFAYLESLFASKELTTKALYALIPIFLLYLIIGRAFCGWVCPMDVFFNLLSKKKFNDEKKIINNQRERLLKKIGYGIAIFLLIQSAVIEIPIFTNYMSHLTNFFRALTAGVFSLLSLPFEKSLLIYSLSAILFLLILELIYPRLWCKSLCPIGKTYGLFNKISLLRLSIVKDTCIQCGSCNESCYMDIDIASNTDKAFLRDSNCILCGRCVDACDKKAKTLSLKFRR